MKTGLIHAWEHTVNRTGRESRSGRVGRNRAATAESRGDRGGARRPRTRAGKMIGTRRNERPDRFGLRSPCGSVALALPASFPDECGESMLTARRDIRMA